MKRALIVLLACVAPWSVSLAASPEDDYLAARDAYIKTMSRSQTDSDVEKHNAALADLEGRLRKIIGPTASRDFAGEGKIHLDGLIDGDEGFGLLDGLVYERADKKASLVVTTANLFDTWLRQHKDWWPDNPLPQDIPAALRSDDFYTQSISTDAAVVTYAEIPVVKPAWATIAYAMLATRTQDDIGPIPHEINVFVRRADRVFIVTAKTDVKAGPIAACGKAHDQVTQQADKAGDRLQGRETARPSGRARAPSRARLSDLLCDAREGRALLSGPGEAGAGPRRRAAGEVTRCRAPASAPWSSP